MILIQIISALSAFLALVLVAAALIWWQSSRADEILRQWAKETGVELLLVDKRYLRTGPFLLQHCRGQFVFRIIVRNRAGMELAGWIRIGGCLAGVLSDNTKVIWD